MSRGEVVRAEVGWPATVSAPAVKQQQLRARLGEMRRRGEIEPGYELVVERGVATAHVVRLREHQSRKVTWVVAGAAAILGSVSMLGWLLWQSRYVILAGVALVLVLLAVAAMLPVGNHGTGCVGLHCAGCRG